MKPKFFPTIIGFVPILLFIPSILKNTTSKYSFVKIQSNYGMLQQDSQTLISQDLNPKSPTTPSLARVDTTQYDNITNDNQRHISEMEDKFNKLYDQQKNIDNVDHTAKIKPSTDKSDIQKTPEKQQPIENKNDNTKMNQENDGYHNKHTSQENSEESSNNQDLNENDNDNIESHRDENKQDDILKTPMNQENHGYSRLNDETTKSSSDHKDTSQENGEESSNNQHLNENDNDNIESHIDETKQDDILKTPMNQENHGYSRLNDETTKSSSDHKDTSQENGEESSNNQHLNENDNDNIESHRDENKQDDILKTPMNQENYGYSRLNDETTKSSSDHKDTSQENGEESSNDQHLYQRDNDNTGIDEEEKSSSDQKNINEKQEATSKKPRKLRKKNNKEQNNKKEILNRFIEFIESNNDQGDQQQFADQLPVDDLRLLDVNIIEHFFNNGSLSIKNIQDLITENIERTPESPIDRNQADLKSKREIAKSRWKALKGGSIGYLPFALLLDAIDFNIITPEDIKYIVEQEYIDHGTLFALNAVYLGSVEFFNSAKRDNFKSKTRNIQESLDNYKLNKIKGKQRRKNTEPKDITLHDLLNKKDEEIDKSKKKTLLVNLFINHIIVASELRRLVKSRQIDQTLYNNIINDKKIKKVLDRRKLDLTQSFIDVNRINDLRSFEKRIRLQDELLKFRINLKQFVDDNEIDNEIKFNLDTLTNNSEIFDLIKTHESTIRTELLQQIHYKHSIIDIIARWLILIYRLNIKESETKLITIHFKPETFGFDKTIYMKNYHVLSTSAEGKITELDEQLEQKSPQQKTQKTEKTQETKTTLKQPQIKEMHKKLEQEAPIEFEITFEQLLEDNKIDIDVEEIKKQIGRISDYFKRGPHKLEDELRTKLSNLLPFHSDYIKVIVQWLIIIYYFAKNNYIKIQFKKETFGLDAEFDMFDLILTKSKNPEPLFSDTQKKIDDFYEKLIDYVQENINPTDYAEESQGPLIYKLIDELLDAYERILDYNLKYNIKHTMIFFLLANDVNYIFVVKNDYIIEQEAEFSQLNLHYLDGQLMPAQIIIDLSDLSNKKHISLGFTSGDKMKKV